MRSRYSAYVLKLSTYLAETWHPSTRPTNLDLTADTTAWQGLEIIACEDGIGDSHGGYVEFVAQYAGGQLHERSRFLQEGGRWFYVDGEILPPLPPAKVGRNDPCPCGSGIKYKRCCG